MERGQYGGTPTLMNTLPVGTKFYVCNGAWNGTITEKNGIKHVKVDAFEDREIPLTGDNEDYMLDINIEEKRGRKRDRRDSNNFKSRIFKIIRR